MSIRNVLIATSVVLVVASGCSKEKGASGVGGTDSSPATSSAAPAKVYKVGESFRNGPFEITVKSIKFGVPRLDVDAAGKAEGMVGVEPEHGQFVQVFATAKNVGTKPAVMSTADSTLIDDKGKAHVAGGPYLGTQGQGLDQEQQPGTSQDGWIAFDLPTTVKAATHIDVWATPSEDPKNLPTRVAVK